MSAKGENIRAAGEVEAGHGDAQHAKSGQRATLSFFQTQNSVTFTSIAIAECSEKRGGCKQEELPVLVNSAGRKDQEL